MVAEAVAFARGRRGELGGSLAREMSRASGAMEFERAAEIRRQLALARRAEGKGFRFVRDAEEFCWLIVQRGGGTTRVKPFVIRRGWIIPGETVGVGELEGACEQWIAAVRAGPDEGGDEVARAEQTWLVSHFLFKQERAGGVYVPAGELPDAAGLAGLVRGRLDRGGRRGEVRIDRKDSEAGVGNEG
jgi:hypothetical protein